MNEEYFNVTRTGGCQPRISGQKGNVSMVKIMGEPLYAFAFEAQAAIQRNGQGIIDRLPSGVVTSISGYWVAGKVKS